MLKFFSEFPGFGRVYSLNSVTEIKIMKSYLTGLVATVAPLIFQAWLSQAEFFTAVVNLEKLLHTESEIVRTLDMYVTAEEERLQKIKRLYEDYVNLHRKAAKDTRAFLSNPLNAFLLLKRLTIDWGNAQQLIEDTSSKDLMNSTLQGLPFPNDIDVRGAAQALFQLQDMYKLDTSTMAMGRIEGAKSFHRLSGGDCFQLGLQAYTSMEYRRASLWMQEALHRLQKHERSVYQVDILHHLSYSSYKLGDISLALKFTNDLLEIDSRHTLAARNLRLYHNAIDAMRLEGNATASNCERQTQEFEITALYGDNYTALCRGQKLKSPAEESQLHCRYVTNNSSFLFLQPAKEEELHLKPRLVVYHDIISDHEIEVIKNLSIPKLQTATVLSEQTQGPTAIQKTTVRSSNSGWLWDNHHEVVERLSKRIRAVTGLTLDSVEALQVVNYGIGGFYHPHFDFAGVNQKWVFGKKGNRIATWINYMSDVESGGSTAFPRIGVQVKPEKGSAAFWYNLKRNGEGNPDTLHAGCPVLAGSKWVSNKWIHENGEMFTRPCATDPDV